MKYLPSLLALSLLCLPFSANAQSVVDQKAEADLALARANLDKARLDELAALRTAAAGTTATMSASDKSAEATVVKYAVYRGAVTRLAARFRKLIPASKSIHPIVVIGSTPPSISQWLAFETKRRAVDKNMFGAIAKWNHAAHPGKMMAVPVGILLSALSVFRTDTVISGAALSLEDARVASLLNGSLDGDYGVDYLAFEPGRSGASDVSSLLTSEQGYYATLQQILTVEYPALVAKAKHDGVELSDEIKAAEKDVETAKTDFETLRDSLYADTGGLPLATVIVRQKQVADDDGTAYPILYVTSQEGSLTTITKKNFLTGLASTPATLTGMAVLNYVLVGQVNGKPVRERGMVSCVLDRQKFDGALAYPIDDAGGAWADLCRATDTVDAIKARRAPRGS